MTIRRPGSHLLLLGSAFLTTLSTPAYSMPEVEGNTISWPDDGWYQVQLASDFTSVCEGGLSCDVANGEYIVINHTTGERFPGIIVSETETSSEIPDGNTNAGTPTLDGNTISFSNRDWYQVQRADNFMSLCEGSDPCSVTAGTYIVINHTSGQRFTFEVEDSTAITVAENTISWPDNGWYQVQDANNFQSICEGTTNCLVDAGTYIVINHTTGLRTEITVAASAEPEEPETQQPLINENSWLDILAEVVNVINGQPLEAIDQNIRDNHFELENSQLPGEFVVTDRQPLDATNEFLLALDCLLGGSAAVQYTRDVTIETDWNYENCQLSNQTANGRHFFSNQGSREGASLTLYENFTIRPHIDVPELFNEFSLELNGSRTTSADRIQFAQSRNWIDTNLNFAEFGIAIEITGYNMMSGKRTGPSQRTSINSVFIKQPDGSFEEARLIENNATLTGNFVIQAPWTVGQTVSVSVELSYDGDYVEGGGLFENSGQTVTALLGPRDDAFSVTLEMTPQPDNALARWNTGRLSITANDGSSLELDAATGSLDTFSVSINNEEAISWPWTPEVTPVCLGPFEACQ